MRPLFIPLVVIVIAAASAFALTSGGPAAADTASVDVGSNWFCASGFEGGDCTTTINAGDTINWTVSEGIHTVTECEAGHASCGGGFDSGVLETGGSFSQTFASPGTYYYYCALHPSDMQGTIVVLELTPTPTPVPATDTPAPTDGTTAAPTTAAPAGTQTPGSVPQTGGPPASSGGVSLLLLALAAGAALVIGGGSAVFAARRR